MKPTNKISTCLREMAEYVADPEFDTHPDVPDEMNDYAALVDRLVKAAKRLKAQAKMTDDYCDSIGGTLRSAVVEMSAALRDIELESEEA